MELVNDTETQLRLEAICEKITGELKEEPPHLIYVSVTNLVVCFAILNGIKQKDFTNQMHEAYGFYFKRYAEEMSSE
jgi:hypothetical protein